ncbi:RRQRL motif-containing zinc-binding protein [Nocardia sp. NPDC052001]|uniref:RRQRL motif-containing zinc-binding protein n=1 Tax=Nocardia sp. NPDC052001 TaxID=3154853 RepID=UPI00342897E8
MSEGIPVYPWRMAPAHLRTKRQLDAEGLRPNGQDIQGILPPRGRVKVAYLFDVNLAAPKFPCTEANRVALAKANRERQLRAAERRGIDRSEFESEGDPGPGWGTPSRSALADYKATSALAASADHETEHEGMEL